LISREKMIALYSAMMKYRLLAEATERKLQRSWQLSQGLEATVAAITADLRREDAFFATGSKLASALVDGANGKALVATALKSVHARNGHIPASVVEKEFTAALTAGDALKSFKGEAVCLLFCESRTPAALWRKHLQQASRNHLPIVFARLGSASRHPHSAPGALSFGVPQIAVDAGDVRAVYRVASESIARARHRRGPTLIECLRVSSGETTADPIRAMELVLDRKGFLSARRKREIDTQISRDVKSMLRQLPR
jgi:Dehydrogenase E1 component